MTALSKLTDRFTEAEIKGEIVIMRLDSGEFFSLSGTSLIIWRLIDGKRDRTALLAALGDQFQADAAVAADVDELLSQLRETGLVG